MRWFVVCPEYRCGPFSTQEAAERRAAQVGVGGHCSGEHRIEVETPAESVDMNWPL